MRSLVLLLALCIVGGCSPRKGEQLERQSDDVQKLEAECSGRGIHHKWFIPQEDPAGGQLNPRAESPPLVALVVHGLNNQPAIMDPLIAVLNSNSVPALRLSLSGHEPAEDMSEMGTIERWRCDVGEGISQLRLRYPKSAIIGLGFSLGGTILADAAVRATHPPLSALVLLAPAIKFTWRGTAIRMLSVLRAFGIALKSKSLAAYRGHAETPLSAYHALFTLASEVATHSSAERLAKLPALVLLSPKDELISFSRLSRWINQNSLVDWKLEPLAPNASIEGSFQHLVVDEPSLGSAEWSRLRDLVTLFVKRITEQEASHVLLRQSRVPGAANLQ